MNFSTIEPQKAKKQEKNGFFLDSFPQKKQSKMADSKIFVLRDSTKVLIRPTLHDDKPRLINGLQTLSKKPYSFQGLLSYLQSLLEIANHHNSFIVIDPLKPNQPALAFAQYIRLKKEPEVAEVALMVVDNHQGKGLGTLLLGLLKQLAFKNGICYFRAYVHTSNKKMLKIMKQAGCQIKTDNGYEIVHADVDHLQLASLQRLFLGNKNNF